MTPALAHSPAPVHRRRLYTGEQVAAAVGLSWDRFRKVRTVWTRDRDFPAELNEPNEPVRYDADAVDAWFARRTRRVTAPALAPEPDLRPPADHEQRAARDGRARLRLLRGD